MNIMKGMTIFKNLPRNKGNQPHLDMDKEPGKFQKMRLMQHVQIVTLPLLRNYLHRNQNPRQHLILIGIEERRPRINQRIPPLEKTHMFCNNLKKW